MLIQWQIRFVVNRIQAAKGFARTAIHALFGVDVERTSAFIDAVHGALLRAGFVHHVCARSADYVSHSVSVLAAHWWMLQQKAHFQKDL